MNTKIAFAAGMAAILATILALPQAVFAAELNVSITSGSSTKTTDAYSPNPAEVNVGDTVIWTNDDSTPHTATSGTSATATGVFGGEAGSFGTFIAPQQTQRFMFTEAGEFPYFCGLHPNMVGTVIVGGAGNGGPQEFSVTATDGGNDYEITGTSATAEATSATINPGQSVEIEFNGTGAVELTLPKTMIDNITMVNGEQATIVNETDAATTISFEVPEGETTVTIQAGYVVPEFPVVVALILGASIAAILAYTRFAKGNVTGLFGRA